VTAFGSIREKFAQQENAFLAIKTAGFNRN